MPLRPVSEAGTGRAQEDEKRRLTEIVERMNDLFAGDLSEADMVGYVTTIQGKLLENKTLAAQAENNTKEQFGLGDFESAHMDAILDSQNAHNRIAERLLKDKSAFASFQKLMVDVVYDAFRERTGR